MSLQTQVVHPADRPFFNVFGPVQQFLVAPDQVSGAFGLMRAMVPPGAAIPLHSHADPEVFCLLEGTLHFLQYDDGSSRWVAASPGDTVSIPGDVKHALWNRFLVPVMLILVATPNIYSFFLELAKPLQSNKPAGPPTPADMQRLLTLAAKYKYWIASPQENAAIGLTGF